jgi:HEAT repeat protein
MHKMSTNDKQIESKIKLLIDKLRSQDGSIRKQARHELVEIGSAAISELAQHIETKKHNFRWEIVKTLEQIADPQSAPYMIKLLEDEEFAIRWLAAEGLIRMGSDAIKPLLEALIHQSDSVFMREGAHHVLYALEDDQLVDARSQIRDLMNHLKKVSSVEDVPILASRILQSM